MNVYLDYAATTPLDEEVLNEMLPFMRKNFGNPDSLHGYGRDAAYAVTRSRDRIARVLGVNANEIYFTSGGTEADNWAVRCAAEGPAVVSDIEHQAVLSAAELRRGAVFFAHSDGNGAITAQTLAAAMPQRTGLACVMAVNNETGVIQPIKELSALCKERGALLFSDCVQAAVSQDVKELCSYCDLVSLSGHKLYGPKGIGVLVVKKGVKLSPLIAGGEQERGLRGGTLNPAAIVGFAAALERAQGERERFCAHTQRLRDRFEEIVFSALGDRVKRDGQNRAPNVSHLTFERGGEAFLNRLDLCGVACSGGAACSAHAALPSHVMLAMGRTEEEARRGVRFSFGRDTTEEEVLFAAEKVVECARF